MPTLSNTPVVNAAIAEAKSLPALIQNLQAVDPALATQLESKPLLASKTVYGMALTPIIAMLAAKYGVGFDTATDQLISGAIVLGATSLMSVVMRLMTKQPIAGIVSTPPSATTAADVTKTG